MDYKEFFRFIPAPLTNLVMGSRLYGRLQEMMSGTIDRETGLRALDPPFLYDEIHIRENMPRRDMPRFNQRRDLSGLSSAHMCEPGVVFDSFDPSWNIQSWNIQCRPPKDHNPGGYYQELEKEKKKELEIVLIDGLEYC